MQRSIVGFHQDDGGEWVAELACLHNQHVRHQPPFQDRPWILSETQRSARIGMALECRLCERAEMPAGLILARVAGPFDAETLPAGLRREHRVGDGTWGCLCVLEGAVAFVMEVNPPLKIRLEAGDRQPIPPGVPHLLELVGPVGVTVEFFVAADPARPQ